MATVVRSLTKWVSRNDLRRGTLKSWNGGLRRMMLNMLPRAWRERPSQSDEQPLRSELFSTDQLEKHAKALAGRHEVDQRIGPDHLLSRLEKNEAVLLEAHHTITAAVTANRRMSPDCSTNS